MTDFTEQSAYLTVLAHTPPDALKPFTEAILMHLEEIEVLENRTGLVMLPYTDSVQGTAFHLGEVLMSEAHVRIGECAGYGACLGRDLEQALAIAILDATLQAQDYPVTAALHDNIRDFVAEQAQQQTDADQELLRKVEATRVEMEVF